jgi:hypothetical protein
MKSYDGQFADSGEIRWLPYLMYFHPCNYTSDVVNTDTLGFRYSECTSEKKHSVSDTTGGSVRLIAGSSTVFGIGASSDGSTLASCLNRNDIRQEPWLNFGGRSFNSTQEVIQLILNKHRLTNVEEIVVFSGFNDLGLAKMPDHLKSDGGAFFNCEPFYDLKNKNKSKLQALKYWITGGDDTSCESLSLPEQMDAAANQTLQNLLIWKLVADHFNAKLTYVLQPLANWVRSSGSVEEENLFAELDELGDFTSIYGDILTPKVCEQYGLKLQKGCEDLKVEFINMAPIIAESVTELDWIFVDRIHFTDHGHNLVSKLILENL